MGERMRKAREKQGRRQIDFAIALGKTQPAIHSWETDQAVPRLQEIRRVARLYRLPLVSLIPRERAA